MPPKFFVIKKRNLLPVFCLHYLASGLLTLKNLFRIRHQPKSPPSPSNILFVGPDHLGDILIAAPLFRIVRNRFPNANITISAKLAQESFCKDLLKIDVFHSRPCSTTSPFFKQFRAWKNYLRINVFDCVIFYRSMRQFLPATIASYLLNISYRIGSSEKGHGPFHTHSFHLNELMTQSDYSLKLAETFIGNTAPPPLRAIKLDSTSFAPIRKKPFDVLLAPFAQHPRIWSEQSWREVLDFLNSQSYSVGILGLPNDLENYDSLVKGMNSQSDFTSLIGTLDLPEVFQTIKDTKLLIALDSGTRHIAAMTGTRCIVIGHGADFIEVFGQYVDSANDLSKRPK